MEKLLRVKASKFKGEELNLISMEEVIEQGYVNVAYSDIKVDNDLIDVNFTILIDNDVELTYADKIITDTLTDFFKGIEGNISFFSPYEGSSVLKYELNRRIVDVEEKLLSE